MNNKEINDLVKKIKNENKMLKFQVTTSLEKSPHFQGFAGVRLAISPYQEDKALFLVTREVLLNKPNWVNMDTSQDYTERVDMNRSGYERIELQKLRQYEFMRR